MVLEVASMNLVAELASRVALLTGCRLSAAESLAICADIGDPPLRPVAPR
ncbi:hypothetical protein OG785_05075 [Streptomyces sp. NBC_00006]|nr:MULTISPECIES: hypothetical protein [unclassified Streptomyces]MCX5529930.1 hypothetical protein [Streptomyces sp. NBC_00006]